MLGQSGTVREQSSRLHGEAFMSLRILNTIKDRATRALGHCRVQGMADLFADAAVAILVSVSGFAADRMVSD